MAKAPSKAPVKTVKKQAAPKKSAAKSASTSASSTELIVKACEASLAKLNALNIEHELQSEINWCLGSFQNDGNPVGLFQMAERSLNVFKAELARKTKGVTAAFISDLDKALKSR